MVPLYRALPAAHLVGVEHKNYAAGPKAAVIAQRVHQRPSCGLDVYLSQRVQIVPRKNDIVAVNQQIFRSPGQGRGGLRAARSAVFYGAGGGRSGGAGVGSGGRG